MAKAASAGEAKPLGIYVHIPFCRSKCEYCDFYSLGGGRNSELMRDYLSGLLQHIREAAARAPGYIVDTIYFGGGTPSFYGVSNCKRILAEIQRRFHVAREAEITLEANPDSVTPRGMHALVRAGFNRISIGVQSDSDEHLRALGRPHNWEQARLAVENAKIAGFENISIDLMYGLPNQTREGWAQTLRSALSLQTQHISCYGLKVEEGTPLYEYRDCVNLPDDDTQADMYLYAVSTLAAYGYQQYEISNFALEGYASRHNLKYWLGGEYLSFGPSAASDFAGKRYTYRADLQTYLKGLRGGENMLSECESIPLRERGGEYLMLRLRTAWGIEENEYQSTYLMPFAPLEEKLQEYAGQKLAFHTADGRWRLTPQGFLVSNQIIGELLEIQNNSHPIIRT